MNCMGKIFIALGILLSAFLTFSQNLTPTKDVNGEWGYKNDKGEWQVKPQYSEAYEFSEGLACVKAYIGGRYGYIDENGNVVIGFYYYMASKFNNGHAIVSKNCPTDYYHVNLRNEMCHNFHVIDKNGDIVIEKTDYFVCEGYHNEWLKVCRIKGSSYYNEKAIFGYINIDCNEVIPIRYQDIGDIKGNYFLAKKNDKYGVVNTNNTVLIPFIYDEICYADNDCFVCGNYVDYPKHKNMKFGVVDTTNKVIIPFKYDILMPSGGDLIMAGLGGIEKEWNDDFFSVNYHDNTKPCKFGYINMNDEIVIPFDYEFIDFFKSGTALCDDDCYNNCEYNFIKQEINEPRNNYWEIRNNSFCIDIKGRKLTPANGRSPIPYDLFVKEYVEKKINMWQKKGEFETIAQYKERMTNENRQEMIASYAKEAENVYIDENKRIVSTKSFVILGDYDADNETFMIHDKDEIFPDFLLNVPFSEAKVFKEKFGEKCITLTYAIENNFLRVVGVTATINEKKYAYKDDSSLTYSAAEISYNFDPINIEVDTHTSAKFNNQNNELNISPNKIIVGESDVDTNIPVCTTKNDNTYVLIIANENYRREEKVPFAVNDGKIFKEYCLKTLGIPEKHIKYTEDATLIDMRHEITWLKSILEVFDGKANGIVYYSGHGIPDESTGNAFILPVDGYSSDSSTGYSMDILYEELGIANARHLTFFIDACFSGAKKNDGMLLASRGVAIKTKGGRLHGNTVLFSATTSAQSAYAYQDKSHGMFTYFLLKKLKDTNGLVKYKELSEYITNKVIQTSLIENGNKQTPQVISSSNVAEEWENWSFYDK